ncbi:hypothetical protein [Sulfuricystis thermophila]|uniref:hypothetical protein n=1 Tax=Sulfuricystis thermophila TaxID=2496847 RepID=UPI001035A102|nr:hypothetical protein [Sulfuricystis thermophila]
MKLRGYLQNILYLFLFGLMSQASATPYYSHDFQWDIGASVPGWSAGTIQSAPNPDYGGWRRFLGEFSNAGTSLSLAGLPTHDAITLSFDLYLLRSWDGEAIEYGPDRFGVSADSALLFLESFSNGHPAGQSYCPGDIAPCSPMTGAAERYSLGYSFGDWIPGSGKDAAEVMDAVYRLTLSFPHSADSLILSFFGEGLQGTTASGYLDEAWGLDNISILLHDLPEPSALVLLSVALALMLIARLKHLRNARIIASAVSSSLPR